MAATMWGGAAAVVSHRAAACLHGLKGFDGAPLEISTSQRGRKPQGVIVHNRTFVLPRREVQGVPVTPVELTLLDLHAVAHPRRAGDALDDALARKLTDLPRLYRTLGEHSIKGRRGVRAFRAALEARDPELSHLKNELEREMRSILRRAGLGGYRKDFRVYDGSLCIAEIDFAYPHALVGVEADGHAFHSSRSHLRKDKARDRILELGGWLILRYTWEDVFGAPDGAVRDVRTALDLRTSSPKSTLSVRSGEKVGGA